MSEASNWEAEDFPPGDRKIWEEWYEGRGGGDETVTASEPVRAVEIPLMPIEEARERIRQLHSIEIDGETYPPGHFG